MTIVNKIKCFIKRRGLNNIGLHAKRELERMKEYCRKRNDTCSYEYMFPEIIKLCNKFGKSGQSGMSAPMVAAAMCNDIKEILNWRTVAPIEFEELQWSYGIAGGTRQSSLLGSLFKEESTGKCYYLDAVVFQGEDEYDSFTSGNCCGVSSSQYVKFPFTPKTFYIDVKKVPYDSKIDNDYYEDKQGSKYVYVLKNPEQLKEVFKYYNEKIPKKLSTREKEIRKNCND